MRLLLVDDSSTMRRIQRTQLTVLGISDIIEAENGEDALNKLAHYMPVDIVLLDWNMPVMDGLVCLESIKKNSQYKGVKVIMCTSESEKSKVIIALKAGADNYIVKPFTPDALKEKLCI